MSQKPYTTLHTEHLHRNRWYALRRDQIRFPDGSEGEYNVVERSSSVFIVPVLTDGRIVLIRNYRYTIDRWLWEVPAGGLEAGLKPEAMAARELAEEIGGEAQRWQATGTFYTAPGFCDERSHVFLAHGVTLGTPAREASEVMEIHTFPVNEVLAMIADGRMQDGPSALSVLLSVPHLES